MFSRQRLIAEGRGAGLTSSIISTASRLLRDICAISGPSAPESGTAASVQSHKWSSGQNNSTDNLSRTKQETRNGDFSYSSLSFYLCHCLKQQGSSHSCQSDGLIFKRDHLSEPNLSRVNYIPLLLSKLLTETFMPA